MLLGGVHRTVIPECVHSSAAQPAQNILPKLMRTGNEKDAEGMMWYFHVEALGELGLDV